MVRVKIHLNIPPIYLKIPVENPFDFPIWKMLQEGLHERRRIRWKLLVKLRPSAPSALRPLCGRSAAVQRWLQGGSPIAGWFIRDNPNLKWKINTGTPMNWKAPHIA
jgi:hypothetical protein